MSDADDANDPEYLDFADEDEYELDAILETGVNDPFTHDGVPLADEGTPAVSVPVEPDNTNAEPDPVGVVVEGQNDGLAHRVTRALGGTDAAFTGDFVEAIEEFRESMGLDAYPERTVIGKLWAFVLPSMKLGYRGVEVAYLCKAIGVPVRKVLDAELLSLAVTEANMDWSGPVEEYEWDLVDWLEVL